ncbi:MAG TPA: GNAT family N-acetyltransferase [Pedobacter sp.]|jgi:GNAT superfamily N-acetyltransferase
MRTANATDKGLVIDILTDSFQTNKSVNFIIKQEGKRIERIRALMDYSFDICFHYGRVFISDDKTACALVLFPDQKKTTLRSILLDLKLVFKAIGISNIGKTLKRESLIKKIKPKKKIYYLWFIGVKTDLQGKGIGTRLLKEILEDSNQRHRSVCLETSTLKNLPWYTQFGFQVYNELDLGYQLFFLKRDIQ